MLGAKVIHLLSHADLYKIALSFDLTFALLLDIFATSHERPWQRGQ